MSARVRTIAVAVGVLTVGLVVLFFFNSKLFARTEPKTWIVHPGETLHVSADQVLPEDRWECPGKGGSTGTPPPGHGVGSSLGFSMEVDMDGNVTAYCEAGPPAQL